MVMNGNNKVVVPDLKINDENKVLPAKEIVYLGDVFNEMGNNDGLIADRIKRGTKAMVTIWMTI